MMNMQFNPMQLMQMMKNGGNPRQMLINMMKQQAGNNPVMSNALQMMEKGDSKGVEQLCRNLGKEKNVDIDQMMNQIKNQFGMK